MMTSKLAASLFMLAVYAVALSAMQNALRENGTIAGILTKAGTSDPLANVQVTLEGGVVDPKVMQLILNSAATAGIVVTPPPGASLSEITRLMVADAAARSLPIGAPGIEQMVNNAAGSSTWPTVVSRSGGLSGELDRLSVETDRT